MSASRFYGCLEEHIFRTNQRFTNAKAFNQLQGVPTLNQEFISANKLLTIPVRRFRPVHLRPYDVSDFQPMSIFGNASNLPTRPPSVIANTATTELLESVLAFADCLTKKLLQLQETEEPPRQFTANYFYLRDRHEFPDEWITPPPSRPRLLRQSSQHL